jgi:RNA polymerase sigma-70 factor (ECF subfamily)
MNHDRLKQQFLEAYEAYADQLFRHCVLRIRDRECARELVQETFMKAWTYAASGRDIQHMRGFLFKVANNLIINESVRRKPAQSLDQLMENTGMEPEAATDTDKAAQYDIDTMVRALGQLDDTYRIPLIMRYLDELPVSEIAAALNLSESNVSVRIHRALQKLRNHMGFDTSEQ